MLRYLQFSTLQIVTVFKSKATSNFSTSPHAKKDKHP